jgi:hypothetical protein
VISRVAQRASHECHGNHRPRASVPDGGQRGPERSEVTQPARGTRGRRLHLINRAGFVSGSGWFRWRARCPVRGRHCRGGVDDSAGQSGGQRVGEVVDVEELGGGELTGHVTPGGSRT